MYRITTVTTMSYSTMDALYNNLTGLNKHLRPQKDFNNPTIVYIEFYLLNLQEVDAVEGIISMTGFFVVGWMNANMKWDPDHFDGIQHMILPQEAAWKPPLLNANTAKDFSMIFDLEGLYLYAHNSGYTTCSPGQYLHFSCDIDTTYFPFDTQDCQMYIVAWGYPETELILFPSASVVNLEHYSTNSEWELSNNTVKNLAPSLLSFRFKLKRRPLFLLVTLVIPVELLALLNITVFLLPQESGERIGFSITLLLAVVVFLTIAQGLLPATAEPRLSAICIILIMNLALSGLILISIIISSRIHFKPPNEKVPNWIKTLARFKFCCNSNKVISMDSQMTDVTKSDSDETGKTKQKVTWHQIARLWDCLSFVFYFLVLIAGNLVYTFDVINGQL